MLSVHSFGQNMNFESVGLNVSEDLNLPSLESYKVKQDKSGNIWICTDGGVVKYDGNERYTFTVEDGLLNNVVFDIYEDYKGRIWFLGMKNELCYYFENKIHPYRYNNLLKDLFNGGNVIWKSIYVDEEENLYYSLFSYGIHKIDKNGELTHFEQKKGITINQFKHDYQISILKSNNPKDSLNYRKNYDFYYNNNKHVRKFKGINNTLQNPIRHKDSSYYIIFGRLFTESVTPPLLQEVNYVQKFQEKLMVSTKNGFYLGEQRNGSFKKTSPTYLANNFITSTCTDSEGGLWVSTLQDGVFYFSTLHLEKIKELPGGKNDNVLQIAPYKNSVLALTLNKLFIIDQDTINTYSYKNKFNRMVTYNDEIHLFCISQASTYVTKNLHHHIFSRDAKVFKNKIYYSTSDKLISSHTKTQVQDTLMFREMDERFTYSGFLEVIDSTQFLVSDISNLYLIENKKIIKQFSDSLNIKALLKVNANTIYVLDRNKGIYTYSVEKQTLTPLQKINRLLPHADYNKLAMNDTLIFIGSNEGLIYLNTNNNEVHLIGANYGILEGKIHSIQLIKNHLYFGTKGSVYRFDIRNFDPIQTKVPIENVYIEFNNGTFRSYHVSDRIQLSHSEKSITINANPFIFSNWKNKVYQYRTSKKDKWVDISKANFTLSNLNGSYEIDMRFKTNLNTWSAPINIANITIIPPFYQRWPMLVIYSLLLALLIYAIVRYYLQRKIKKLQTENNLLSYQQRLQNARIKPHFIFNVLNSINSHIHFNETKEASNYLIKFSHLLRNVLEKSGYETDMLSKEVELLNSFLSLEQIRQRQKFEFNIMMNEDLEKMKIPTFMIQPFVENAVFHGLNDDEDNLIEVEIKRNTKSTVEVEVRNSKTMTLQQIENWHKAKEDHAISLTKNRLDNYNKIYQNDNLKIQLRNSNNLTTVVLILPIIND